jgi:hypothetical protein
VVRYAFKGILTHLKVASLQMELTRAKLKANNNLFFEESTKRVCRQGKGPLGLPFATLSLGLYGYHLGPPRGGATIQISLNIEK